MVRRAARGYDADVAGLDEARARSVLAEMHDRLARDPRAALGIAAAATPADVRAAFLQLTKQFHPVRFGRMSIDVQKMANEVFLALRAAHDAFARPIRPPSPSPSPSPSPRPASAPHTATAASSGRTTQTWPLRPPTARDTGERPPVVHPSTQGGKPPVTRPVAPGAPAHAAPVAAPPGRPHDESSVLDLLHRQRWDQARSALHQLAAGAPNSKRIRALMCYARGREAQLDRRLDDARVELQDALDLDPDLQVAKTALAELFTRRK